MEQKSVTKVTKGEEENAEEKAIQEEEVDAGLWENIQKRKKEWVKIINLQSQAIKTTPRKKLLKSSIKKNKKRLC